MSQLRLMDLRKGILCCLCGFSTTLFAAPITWNATSSNSDLNTASNWSPETVPGAGDDAIFDSTIPGINTSPSATANFSVLSFNFLNSAQPFIFGFANCNLTISGAGITGAHTNARFNLSNLDNSAVISGNQLFFTGSNNSSGNASIHITNSGTYTGVGSFISFSEIQTHQFESFGPYSILDGGQLSVSNTGINNGSGFGVNNNIGFIGSDQISFDDTLTVGNNATISISNNGTCNGTTSTQANDNIGFQGRYQLYVGGTFTAGSGLNITASNSGSKSSQDTGGSNIGYSGNSQVNLGGAFVAPNSDHVKITLSNTGLNTGSSTSTNNIGYVGNPQFTISQAFQAGNSFTITATNVGIENESGTAANNVGFIDDPQLEFGSLTVGNYATIAASNSGTSSSTTNSSVGFVSGEQIGTDGFVAGKNLTMTAVNNATNTGTSSNVGIVQGDQISFFGSCTVDDGAIITAINNGTGQVQGNQMNFTQGFSITNGKATFQSANSQQGTVGGDGIFVGGGTGGNVNIILGNSNLVANTGTDAAFTIGQLNGDATSFVQVRTGQADPQLNIATDANVNANFSGSIQNYFLEGVVGLLKTGAGTQKLSGTNTYTGLTTIQEGVLIVAGSLLSDVNVNAGGTLKGSGTIAGVVLCQGKIAPGESIGTITLLSNFTNSGGEYDVEVNSRGQSDLIDVVGIATLEGGNVLVSSDDGTYAFQHRYTIIEAGSVVGTFSQVNAISPLIISSLSYDPQHVYLTLSTNIAAAADTHNQLAVATQLDSIIDPNAQQTLLLSQIASLPIVDAQTALDNLSGYQHTSDLIVSMMLNRQFLRRLYDPLRWIVATEPDACCACSCDNDLKAWFDADGSFIRVRGDENARGFNTSGFGLSGGVQATFCRHWTVGVAAGYEEDDLRFNQHNGTEDCHTWLVGLYGLFRPSCFYGLVDFTYSNSSNKLKRSIHINALDYHAHSKPKTNQYTFYGECGVDVNVCSSLLQPFFGIEAGSFQRHHVTESFAEGWGLVVHKRNRSLTTSRLGFHLTPCCYESNVNISVDLAWNALLTSNSNKIHEHFKSFGSEFSIRGIELNRNSLDYAITISSDLGNNWSGYIEGSGEYWNRANIFDILAGVNFTW